MGRVSKKLSDRLDSPKNPREQHLNAPNLKKYGISFDWMKKKHGAGRTNDSIALYRYLDNEFYGKIVIGSPGQSMNVAFDTAWGLSWVISSKCQYFEHIGCWYHNKYNHDRSSYYKKNGTKYIGPEGSFNFTGFYSYENISIAHSNVTGFSFVEMTSVPSSFLFNKADGVLGLALADPVGAYEPFFYTLLRQGKIKDPIFSIYLNRDPSSNRGGNIMLGFYDEKHIHVTVYPNKTKIPDTIKYLPVTEGAQYWEFSVDRIILSIASNNNVTLCDSVCTAIADTSANTIIGPADAVAKIHDIINAKKLFDRWMVPCSAINKLPKIDFVLDGQHFRMTGKQYIIKMSYMSFTECFSAFTPNSNPNVAGMWVLGGAFLAQYYSIYNIQEKTIGFVRAA